MEESVGKSVNESVSLVKEDPDHKTDLITTMFHRRIEFHLERKPFKGFSDEGNNGFKLETLNPSSSEYSNKSDQHRSLPPKAVSGSEYNRLDPELSLRISFRRIGAGLQNLGNTCFLNAVLQCLTYTEPLAAYLQSGRHKISCRAAGFCALCAIQKHVSCALESTGRILVPKDLVSNLRCISRNFRNARQEDAHEYMMNLLESMHKCCLPSGVPSESPSAYEKSLIHKIFGGRLRSQVKCLQCSFCSNKFDPFLDLSLEIVKADSLSAALANFTAQEHLDGGQKQYQCQHCKQKVRALKQLTVHKAPEVLAIHLKRFASHAPGVKIDKKIEYPTNLDLERFVSGPYDGKLKYTLYGVLVHAGWSTHSGHYYCFVRTTSGMWYCLDDNQVVQVNEGRVLQQKAYMLFYVRDERYSVPKKTVDVLHRKDAVIKALGDKVCNNFNSSSKSEQNEKKSNGSISSTLAQKEAFKPDLFNINGKKPVNAAKDSGGPSEKTSIPNPEMAVSERINGTSLIGPSRCSSLKKDIVTETLFKDLMVNSAEGFPIKKLTDENCNAEAAVPISQNTLSFDKHVQNDNNTLKGSEKSIYDGVHQQSTSSGDENIGKDENGAIGVSSNSASILKSTNKDMQDGGFSKAVGVPDLRCPISDSSIEEAKQPEQDLGRKPRENKLHVVKQKGFKNQAIRFHLSSSIMFGTTLGRKKKIKRRRKHSMAKVVSVSSDIGPSTSKNAEVVQNSPKGVKNETKIKKVDNTKTKLVGNGDSHAKLLLQKTPAIDTEKAYDLKNSGGKGHISTVDAKAETISMPDGGLKDVKVARWDGFEAGPSDYLESGGADTVRIGYVGDEWDEAYDYGKRRKIRQQKLAYEGPNPFQEIEMKRSNLKKAKLNDHHHRPANQQPFRI